MSINAYNIYDAVFDTARSEFWGSDKDGMIRDITDYAEGFFGLAIDCGDAERIADARLALLAANEENGEWGNNHWHLVERPLSAINLD